MLNTLLKPQCMIYTTLGNKIADKLKNYSCPTFVNAVASWRPVVVIGGGGGGSLMR